MTTETITARRNEPGTFAKIGDITHSVGPAGQCGTIALITRPGGQPTAPRYARIEALQHGQELAGATWADAKLSDGTTRRLWQGFQYDFYTAE